MSKAQAEQQTPSKGFVIIATSKKKYIASAIYLADSLRDYYPDAHITLYTTADMLVDVDTSTINNVVVEGVPHDRRAKLWALSRTPYDITAYLDADTVVVSPEISNIFDQLGDNDIIFTKIRKYNSNPKGYLEDPEYIRHGGVFVYRKTADIISFMEQWWKLWTTTRPADIFAETYPDYPQRMKEWDQFYLFYLCKHTDHKLKLGFFEDDARWNFVCGYKLSELGGQPPIIEHYTIKE